LWTAEEALAAVGGRGPGGWQAHSVSIDSRTMAPAALFVALRGPNFDGHDFVADAWRKGAAAAVVGGHCDVSPEVPLLRVTDTEQALRDFGRHARGRSAARILAVTGSVGKTGVKEALRLMLGAQGLTVASEGSLNNHWGVPLSLARLPREARFGVFEIGMNHSGELTPLSRLVRPHVAVVTTVEAVHRAHFASVEEIADAKSEIFAGLEPDGVAIVNRDNRFFERLVAAAKNAGCRRIVSFGWHDAADARLLAAEYTASGMRLRARVGGREMVFSLPVTGRHWQINSICALAAVGAAGGDVTVAAEALAAFDLPKGRGRRYPVMCAGGAMTLIDDSYNASPVSMAASFEVLGKAPIGASGRRIAVLGDMLEIGEQAAAVHAALVEPLVANGIDLVFAAGSQMRHLFDALPVAMRGAWAADSAALAPVVTQAVRGGDVVAVKGSAGSKMGRIAEALRSLGQNEGEG
jgi:UDP-N-acetylmuramoyl-tripeptide--D-alanyl-D-alanine ligase